MQSEQDDLYNTSQEAPPPSLQDRHETFGGLETLLMRHEVLFFPRGSVPIFHVASR